MEKHSENRSDPWIDVGLLEGRRLRLEPLAEVHEEDLISNLLTPGTWHGEHWGLNTRADLERLFAAHRRIRSEGAGCSLVMVLKESGRAVGISRFMDLRRRDAGLEIGGTWVGRDWQRTFVNTEAKLLMLGYAFERLGCQRVEFRVDTLNFVSQAAVLRIGAKFEGELRQSVRLPDGRRRDYRIYSIIDSDWANTRRFLEWKLDCYARV